MGHFALLIKIVTVTTEKHMIFHDFPGDLIGKTSQGRKLENNPTVQNLQTVSLVSITNDPTHVGFLNRVSRSIKAPIFGAWQNLKSSSSH